MYSLAQTMTPSACQGLPSLQRKGPSRGPKGRSNFQAGAPRLQRTLTLRLGSDVSSTATAALPLPFMEISLSLMSNMGDTLDLIRSSVEEEVVFQATLQVPAHHAFACRIEAYDSPFAHAPDLRSAPEQLSEQDHQFAACLASPPDVDEVHHVSVQRAANTAASFVQRSAPSLRFASGVLTVSFSLRQRSSDLDADKKEGEGGKEELDGLQATPASDSTLTPHSLQRADSLQCSAQLSFIGTSAYGNTSSLGPANRSSSGQAEDAAGLQHTTDLGSSTSSSTPSRSSGSSGLQQRKLSRLASTCAPIPEDAQGSESDTAAVRDQQASGAGGSAGEAAPTGRSSLEQQRLVRPTGLLRVQSFTAQGRQTSELPLTTQITSMGVASLLGIGYMMMHAWESRNKPYTQYWQHQVEGLTGNRLQADTPVWREATSFAHA